ncbi:MBOAT family O-acyltransferase [Leptospira idonii]|uniref:MBOAT family protein n=1 Tax=Leptospira idonii TaxID=1193500 RepID=A0A4R9LVZ7_9LEPT|nr:MBOAT family O-acyltransferase [Leptospira idonii]TGN17374.1 MBOAT family protein [Leptospira idonii]
MLFNSSVFILFFSLTYLIYWLSPHKFRKGILIVASLVFYGAWDFIFLLHFVGIVLINYAYYYYFERQGDKTRLFWILLFNAINLFSFKYWNFFYQILLDLGAVVPTAESWATHWILPLAISFYTFQLIAFQMDVHRGDFKEKVGLADFVLFILFFPQLIAGPILRARDFLAKIPIPKKPNRLMFETGMGWILVGLIKKVLIADQISAIPDQIFANPSGYDFLSLLIGIYFFAMQIYCDFAGYTDIARGCSALLGYKLPPNFTGPFLSSSFQEFWRRWHITLSSWLRDYLYFALGGSRKGVLMSYVNLFITMVLGGLWHGANYTFIMWGVWMGALLCGERFWFTIKNKDSKPWPRWIKVPIIFHVSIMSLIFFRADSIKTSWLYFKGFIANEGARITLPNGIGYLVFLFILLHVIEYYPSLLKKEKVRKWEWALLPSLIVFFSFWIAGSVSEVRTFIYFQF